MSYIRNNHPLHWFDDTSDLYVFGRGNGIEDYGGSPHIPSVIDHIGGMINRETKDFEYATLMVIQLADAAGCIDKLRKEELTTVENTIDECRNRIINKHVRAIKKMMPVYNHRKYLWRNRGESTDES